MARRKAEWAPRRLCALLALLAGTWTARAGAQTTGTLVGVVSDAATGKPVRGALVVATSPALQGEQAAVSDAGGRYAITLLPPGRYRVAAQLEGYQPTERAGLLLRVDYTLRANLVLVPESVQIEEQVVKTALAPVVNVGTAEAGVVVSQEYLATVPTARGYADTVIVAPTATPDVVGIGFSGATSPENNYLLDGVRVGDPGYNWVGADLLTNFVEQIDVKTGGFMPEYGYSSAGVVNTVTKAGSNEFHGSLWGNVTPGFLSPAGQTLGRNGEAIASYASPYKGSYDADFGLEVGGPIVKDRLWFYAGLAPKLQHDVRTAYYRTRVPSAADPEVSARDEYNGFVMEPIPGTEYLYGTGLTRYYAVGKLTWLVDENHSLFASFSTQPTRDYGRRSPYGSTPAYTVAAESNTTNVVAGYGGKLLEKRLLLEARMGWYDGPWRMRGEVVNGVPVLQTPAISWRTTQPLENFDPAVAALCPYPSRQAGIGSSPGCYVQNYKTGGWGGVEDSVVRRFSATAAVTGLLDLLGRHVLKAGVQIEHSAYDGSYYVSGGSAWDAWGRFLGTGNPATGGSLNEFNLFAYGGVDPKSALPQPDGTRTYANWCTSVSNGVCTNPGGKDAAQPGTRSSQAGTWANGYYLQDSWTIAEVLTLNAGVRLDTQKMVNTSPGNPPWTPELVTSGNWGPRVQAIWDFTGQGRGKVQANWGRYYESIPLVMAFAAFAPSSSIVGSYQLSTCSDAVRPGPTSTGNPAASCPNVYGLPAGQGPGPNQDALGPSPISGAGFSEREALSPVAPGLRGQFTDQFGGGVQYEVLQDLSIGVDYIGRRLGPVVEDMSSDDGMSYFIANPALSAPWTATTGPYAGVTFNPQVATSVNPTFGTVYAAPWPTPTRAYDAVTVSVTKAFSKRWLAQASYTWSSLRGNFPGLVRPETGQATPNWLAEYDLVTLMGNRSGPLGFDHVHQVKAAGSYSLPVGGDLTFVPGLQLVALSGIPVNVLGAHPLYGGREAFILPRGFAGNQPWEVKLDVSARLDWSLSQRYVLSFALSAFNVLNLQETGAVDQRYTTDFVTPMQGAQCSSRDAISQKDPIAALLARCPDLAYARTLDGLRVTPNLNYGRPTAFQGPISVRLGIALRY